MRLNPTSINVLPVDDAGDIEKAEIYEGLIRQIEYASNTTQAYAHAFECSAGIGIGHFRINTQYAQDSVSDQEITIERIINPLAVVWDSAAVMIDRSDALHCFVTELMPRRVFKKKYPKAGEDDFPHFDQGSALFWRSDDSIRVAEFWHKEPYERTLALMLDGSTVDITDVRKADRKFLPIQQERTFTDYRLKQYMLSGSEILSGPNDWAGKHIPIVPAIGTEIPLDESIVRHGLVRWLKDPQRMYNYYLFSQAELIGQQPRSPFILTTGQVKGYEAEWNTANTNPRPWLPYNADPAAPGAPQRLDPPQASPALWQEVQLATDDMKATTGIHDASLGARSNETSGRAIMAQQREGDVGSYHYFDNFKAAIKRAGVILVDLIPAIYDAPRTVRIIG
ncbi:portal protein [Devosia sp. 2618]|uniref:portal protein n=1 Tax=Devosia sp. 2618 TaxID=3156454 RepID=UPI00339835AC